MPIYEYRCAACGHHFDTIQRFSDAPLTDCPVCGKAELKKMISASAFHLKGTGWYVTDFKNPSKSPDQSKEGIKKDVVSADQKENAKPSDNKTTEKKSEATTKKTDSNE